ncbi:MAG: NUDIX hydrolase [Acidimicrobiia bacterium]
MTPVRAAGGLVTRLDTAGDLQVLVVHRSRYNDWSFPKGKVDEGEGFEDAALREVAEETGLICRLDGELTSTRYRDPTGRPKVVRYWRMIPIAGDIGDFVFNAEIDDLRWVRVDEAQRLLNYRHDRDLLAELQDPEPG